MMAEKRVTDIPVETFRHGIDHFESWVKLFEKAIDLSYKGASEADRATACEQWLPLKLDDKTRLIYGGVTGATWESIKTNLQKALVDPHDEYMWHSRRATIIWDGVESFQSLGTRIMREVDTYQTTERETEYFFRFRLALPKDYKRALDLGCSKTTRTIKHAIDIAERLRVADSDAIEGCASATPKPLHKDSSFSAAAMYDDRIRYLEREMEKIKIRLDNLEENHECGQCHDRHRKKSHDDYYDCDYNDHDDHGDSRDQGDTRNQTDTRDHSDTRDHGDARDYSNARDHDNDRCDHNNDRYHRDDDRYHRDDDRYHRNDDRYHRDDHHHREDYYRRDDRKYRDNRRN